MHNGMCLEILAERGREIGGRVSTVCINVEIVNPNFNCIF